MDIKFGKSSSGGEYVKEFIKNINDAKTQAKIVKHLELLEGHDLLSAIKAQLIAKLHGYNLYEIVIDYNKVFYRILCSIKQPTCWLLHMFKKKKNSTPLVEIKTALQRSILINQERK